MARVPQTNEIPTSQKFASFFTPTLTSHSLGGSSPTGFLCALLFIPYGLLNANLQDYCMKLKHLTYLSADLSPALTVSLEVTYPQNVPTSCQSCSLLPHITNPVLPVSIVFDEGNCFLTGSISPPSFSPTRKNLCKRM